MPSTLTLNDIPDEICERLKLSAQTHRRSMNNEAIALLEAALMHNKPTIAERLTRARALRDALPIRRFCSDDIDAMKREHRS